jgi:protein-tyrosine phosphatase
VLPVSTEQPDGWYDLHLHVLPGIDDGARDLAASVAMARGLADLGYRYLVATPHADSRRHTYGRERIAGLVAELNAEIQREAIEITVGVGAEYAYGQRFYDDLRSRSLITIGDSRYVLLELPEAFMPATMPTTLFEVGAAGYYPIIAHPERCPPFHNDLERLERLTMGRALVQVSFRSLAGTFGRTIKRTAWALLEEGIADMVATDCHSPRELKKIVRPVLKALHKRLPPHYVDRVLRTTPARLMAPHD